MTEYEMGGWRYRLNGHEFEQTLRESEGQPGVLQSMGLQSPTQLRNNNIVINKCLIKELNNSVFKFYLSKVLL